MRESRAARAGVHESDLVLVESGVSWRLLMH
jgi:hypothetical protein